MDEEKQRQMNELIMDVIGTFSKKFPIAYTLCLVENVKSEASGEGGDGEDAESGGILSQLQLEMPPDASSCLKNGFLNKHAKNAMGTSIKRRFFIASNKKDNWRIEYFEKEGEGEGLEKQGVGKKGEINCAGYRVEDFTEGEKSELGQFGLKLVPWSRRRRTWVLVAETEEDSQEWHKTFRNACWYANAPRDKNPLIADAFDIAIMQTRWQYGLYGWYYSWGTEEERLADMISEILSREIVDAILGGIPAGGAYYATCEVVNNLVSGMVLSAVKPCWTTVCTAANAVEGEVKATAKRLLGPLIEQEKTIKDTIVSTISTVTTPFIGKVGGTVLRPFLTAASETIVSAFIEVIAGFHKEATNYSGSSLGNNQNGRYTIESMQWSAERGGGEGFGPAYRLIWKLYYELLSPLTPIFETLGGFTGYMVYTIVMEDLQDLSRRVCYTLGREIYKGENSQGVASEYVQPAEAIAVVTRKLVHDCKIYVKNILMKLMRTMLESTVTETLGKPCHTLVDPIQATIDAIPVPGLSTLFDLSKMLDEVIASVVDDGLDAIVSESMSNINARIESVGTKLGV